MNFKIQHIFDEQLLIPDFQGFFSVEEGDNVIENASYSLDLSTIVLIVYLFGIFIMGIKFLYSILKIISLKRISPIQTKDKYQIIFADVSHVFSWFKWVFVPRSKGSNLEETIIEHEKTHAKLWHSIDLLITELVVVVLWFNPFVYFFRRSINSIHEFQTDQHIIKQGVDKSFYLQLMLDSLGQKKCYGWVHSFNNFNLKDRITMISNNKSKSIHKMKYFIVLPILSVLIFAFSKENLSNDGKPDIMPIGETDICVICGHFGMWQHPVTNKHVMHNGVDIGAEIGTPVVATADGQVVKMEFKEEGKGYGRCLVVKHDEVYSTFYTQLSAYNVKVGQSIKKGEIVGYVGESGISTGPHLHYEVWENGKPVNPEDYFGN